MNLTSLFFAIFASLLTGLLIFFNAPSDKYIFANPTESLHIKLPSSLNSAPLTIKLTDSTLQSGLFFTHQQGGGELTGVNESFGSGACVLDYDNDGWQDLFIVNGSGQNRFYGKLHWWQRQQSHQLFKNNGDISFTNKTKGSGLAFPNWGMGCLATDFNNDGHTDLLITTLKDNQLFKNNGNGTFSLIKDFVTNATWSTSACAADFNNDGLVDLYIANYIDFDKTKLNYEGQSEFINRFSEFFNPTLFNPVSNRLYKNNGDFSFTDITKSSGLTDVSSRSLAVRCVDINGDHLADIIVGNEKGDGSNRLYINQGQLSFLDLSEQYQFQDNTGSRNIAIGDINNDGVEELLLMTGTQQNIRLYQKQLSHKNRPIFFDIARSWGLTDNVSNFQSNWGAGLHDFNMDGLLDFFTVNGFLTPDPDTPRVAKGQPNQLWLNRGKKFQAIDNLTPNLSGSMPEPSRSSVFADFDNDGDIDIYITNNNHLGQLLINDTPSGLHWLGVQLVDNKNHNNLVGTKVSVTSNLGIQTRIISTGDGVLSDSEDRLLFGLNHDTQIKQLTVTWLGGNSVQFNDITIDQYIKIDLSKGIIPNNTSPSIAKDLVALPSKNPAHLARLFSLTTQLKGIESTLPYLKTALAGSDTALKKTAIQELKKYNHPTSFGLLVSSISDADDEVAGIALETLCTFEGESTIRWLIGALSDNRANIREVAALCFEHLYREEEAMIHRKYLALPVLIKRLTENNSNVQIASARALAEAKHFRAVTPLISLLASEKPPIRAETVRSLGLIREKDAIQPLLLLLQKTGETAEVYAQVLVALKRLSYKNYSATFQNFFQSHSPYNSIDTQVRADTLARLYHTSLENIVIRPQSIINSATLLIKKNIDNDELLLKLISIVASSKSDKSKLLTTLTQNPNQNIRLKAFNALLAHYPKMQLTTINQVVQDNSVYLKNEVLKALRKNNIKIPADSLQPFLAVPDTAKEAIFTLANINDRNSTKLLSTALASSSHQDLILQALSASQYSRQQTAKPYLSSPHIAVKQAAYSFYLNKFPQNKLIKKIPDIFFYALESETQGIHETALIALTQRKELWAIKKLQLAILNTSKKDSLRLKLIDNFKHPFQKNWVIMLKIANDKKDSIRDAVIKRLTHYDESAVIDFFKSLASNIETKAKLKDIAFDILARKRPKWALNALLNVSK